jgi:hypothetical protein
MPDGRSGGDESIGTYANGTRALNFGEQQYMRHARCHGAVSSLSKCFVQPTSPFSIIFSLTSSTTLGYSSIFGVSWLKHHTSRPSHPSLLCSRCHDAKRPRSNAPHSWRNGRVSWLFQSRQRLAATSMERFHGRGIGRRATEPIERGDRPFASGIPCTPAAVLANDCDTDFGSDSLGLFNATISLAISTASG